MFFTIPFMRTVLKWRFIEHVTHIGNFGGVDKVKVGVPSIFSTMLPNGKFDLKLTKLRFVVLYLSHCFLVSL